MLLLPEEATMCCKSDFAGSRDDPGSAFTEVEVLDELVVAFVSTALVVTRWKRFALKPETSRREML